MINYAADIVLVRRTRIDLEVLLIERGNEPFKGHWALPGGYVDEGETSEIAAYRELAEETAIHSVHLKFAGIYDQPNRDPRGRVVSAAYVGEIREDEATPIAGDDAVAAQWVPLHDAMYELQLGFDHREIIADAVIMTFGRVRPEEMLMTVRDLVLERSRRTRGH
ncbi:NUDIX hydrolase [Kibdelosporangium aridum]|uniref:NUDIX hydrolase n=1 Tax=Kibdelosporangium aridum TaxID=2030 RepID=A0A428YBV1_KIBAR|nr:NUDIX hydrolase [Kibdelosporangium aridum]RSM65031.1 NUDIX hydrolase [Kibdelosporangium aridum]